MLQKLIEGEKVFPQTFCGG